MPLPSDEESEYEETLDTDAEVAEEIPEERFDGEQPRRAPAMIQKRHRARLPNRTVSNPRRG
jgi:hypothetical protein